VENLAVVNYDTNNLHLAPYDWRLSMWNLEERDGYFSKLKATIEGFKYGATIRISHQTSLYSMIGNDKARRPSLLRTQWVAQYVLISFLAVTLSIVVLLGHAGKSSLSDSSSCETDHSMKVFVGLRFTRVAILFDLLLVASNGSSLLNTEAVDQTG
jgi:hypothetical protein